MPKGLYLPHTLRQLIDAQPNPSSEIIKATEARLTALHKEVIRLKTALFRSLLAETESRKDALRAEFGRL